MDDRYVDAVVVGSGPNGLSAAITMARAGLSVAVLEAAGTAGGGLRSAELTLPGFIHDICAAIHPLALGSPFLSCLPLAEHGLQMIQPAIPAAHPLDDGRTVVLRRSVDETAGNLGADAGSYRWLMEPLVRSAPTCSTSSWDPFAFPGIRCLRCGSAGTPCAPPPAWQAASRPSRPGRCSPVSVLMPSFR